MKIAVVGSGIAGLSAAWFLHRAHAVTLFERHRRIGLSAHSMELDGSCIDVPLRVLYPGYYPQLAALLEACAVPLQKLDAAMSFSDAAGAAFFRYRNINVGALRLPWLTPSQLLQPAPRLIMTDLGRFLYRAPQDLRAGRLAGRSIGDYLHDERYSPTFSQRFLIPCFAGINTASCQDVANYPATLIANYFNRAFLFSSVYRAQGGATAIARALTKPLGDVRLDTPIAAVQRTGNGVTVQVPGRDAERFDAVVFATQANQVLPLLPDASNEERAVLGSFRYDQVQVLMHRDVRLAPPRCADWAPVNYLLDAQQDRPMVSIWVNRLLPDYAGREPLFQTINPLLAVDPALVLQHTTLERPVVDLGTATWLQRLQVMHAQTVRRVFFCGSYASPGIPLLESGVASALALARRLGAA